MASNAADAAGNERDFDKWSKLAEMAQRSFVTRREYEWKIILGFWGVSFATFFLANEIPKLPGCVLTVVVVLFWLTWLRGIWTANRNDKDRYEYYLSGAESKLKETGRTSGEYPTTIRSCTCRSFCRAIRGDWNTTFQLLVTIGIALLIYYKQNCRTEETPANNAATHEPHVVQPKTNISDAPPVTKDSGKLPAVGSPP